MHRFSRSIARFFLAALVIGTLISAKAEEKPAKPKNPNTESLYFWNGRSKVTVDLSLDEIELVAESPKQAHALAAGRGNEARVSADGRGVSLSIPRANGRADLAAQARTLAEKNGAKASRAILYAGAKDPANRQALTHRLSVKLHAGKEIDAIAAAYGLAIIEKISYSPNTYIVEARDGNPLSALDAANQLVEKDVAEWATPLILKSSAKRFTPNDPLFRKQWHLQNTGDQIPNAAAGNDVNITSAWETVTGKGVNIGIVDDGLEVLHEDLAPNARTGIDIDINRGDDDPSPEDGDNHGTAVAGLAAAKGNNAIGVTGAAFNAGLVGIRLVSLPATDAEEAQGMTHQLTAKADAERVHIYSNSWGPSDNGTTLGLSGPLFQAALKAGVKDGRGGKGAIYVWAGGNGRDRKDDSNYDGYANSRYVIAVAASNAAGKQAGYSEVGANLFVNVPSSDTGGPGIVTTDRTGAAGYNFESSADILNYTDTFGGTSAATPVAAGVIALILEANPELTWRDVRHILVRSATRNDPSDPFWLLNGAGVAHNVKYGFGRVNASAAVTLAKSWTLVPPLATPLEAKDPTAAAAIPDDDESGLVRTLEISGQSDFKVEDVEFTVDVTHPFRGDLRFQLTAPSGRVSEVSRRSSDPSDDLSNYTFHSVVHWGENPNGVWTLRVIDEGASDTGTLNKWALTIHGTLGGIDFQPKQGPPEITSALAVSALAGTAFSYSITAVGTQPIEFAAAPLPAGLTFTGDRVLGRVSTPGTYEIPLSATNAEGSDARTLILTVDFNPEDVDGDGIPNSEDPDDDGDGFEDELEDALGTSPTDRSDTPFDGQPAGELVNLFVKSVSLKLNFAKAGADALSVSGSLPLADGVDLAGMQVALDFGGFVSAYTLDAKGKSTPKGFTVSKPKSGFAKYSAKIGKASIATKLADEQLTGTETVKRVIRRVNVTLLFGKTVYRAQQGVIYSAKAGVMGTGR